MMITMEEAFDEVPALLALERMALAHLTDRACDHADCNASARLTVGYTLAVLAVLAPEGPPEMVN